jgi:uncharacterized membrane protein YphA (DoxX/SURF4 family)
LSTPRSGLKLDVSAILARWILAVVFIYMGATKLLAPHKFLELIQQYHLANTPFLLNSIAATLPWFEIFCGLLLLSGVGVRGTALVLVAMLVPFTLAVANRALQIASAKQLAFCAVKFDCGCGSGEVLICHKLVENSILILLACWLLLGHGRQLAARFSLLPSPNA